MEIVGLCQGEPFNPLTWSGSNREIFLALRNRGLLADVVDVEVRGLRRYVNALREYSFDKKVWRHNFLKSPRQFEARSRNAQKALETSGRLPDAVLQIGAMFDGTAGHRELPLYCYLDSNCALSARGGEQSFSHFADAEYKRIAFERERAVYQRSTGVFVFSNFLRNSMIKDFGMAPERVHTVYAGVNLTIPPVDVHAAREPTILFIGKDFERKGGPLLLRAFKRVRAAMPNARLIVAGAQPQIDEPNVEVTGFIDKNTPDGEARLASLYRRAAVFTMPSHFEPFGIVYAEAMHFGVPCVGVRHYAIPEIVTHEQTGLVVTPDNDVELADALLRVLRDRSLALRMGVEGKKKAEALFRWDVVAEKMEAVMRGNKDETCLRAAS